RSTDARVGPPAARTGSDDATVGSDDVAGAGTDQRRHVESRAHRWSEKIDGRQARLESRLGHEPLRQGARSQAGGEGVEARGGTAQPARAARTGRRLALVDGHAAGVSIDLLTAGERP